MTGTTADKWVLGTAAHYMATKGLPQLCNPDYSAFYAAHPRCKGKLKKSLVEELGSEFSLEWDHSISGIRRRSAPDEDLVMAQLAQYLTDNGIYDLDSTSFSSFYKKFPKCTGQLKKKSVLAIGSRYDLEWNHVKAGIRRRRDIGGGSSTNSLTPGVVSAAAPAPPAEMRPDVSNESAPAAVDADYDLLVLGSVEEARELASDLSAVKVLAVDTERGRHQGTEHISLIQIAYRKSEGNRVQVVIFDVLESMSKEMIDQSGLRAALTSHQTIKVIHDCREDSRVLSDDFGVDMTCVFDTQIAHAVLEDKQNFFRVGLNVILAKYSGQTNSCKSNVQHSDDLFDQRPLSELLLRYAAEDVSYLIDVHDRMQTLLCNKGQLECAIERSKDNLHVPPSNVSSERKTFGSILDTTVPLEISKYVQFTPHGAYSLHNSFEKLEPSRADPTSTTNEAGAEVRKLFDILPPDMLSTVLSDNMVGMMTEIVLDLERRPLVRYMSTDPDRTCLCGSLPGREVNRADLEYICQRVGDFSSDNRSGLTSTLHRISRKLNRSGDVIALTLRVGRAVEGTTAMITDIVHSKRSVLLLGVPGVGKTTVLREYSRLLANKDNTRVEIVDTSNEIAGDGDVPHKSVGMARRMMVADRKEQYKVMIEAVQNHMPEVIVVDEIGTKLEAQAVADISQRGVKIVATAHGIELADILRNPELSRLMGGTHTVVLGDDEMKKRKVTSKSVRERKAPPVFDTIIELRNQRQWYIYHDTAVAVDDILADRTPVVEIRSMDPAGHISARKSKLIY